MTDLDLEALDDLLDATCILKSTMKPSEWYESRMVMPQGSAFPGPIKYSRTPFWREPVDCADPNHPARDITIMGPAQMGKSIMVLNPIVGYSIAQDPGNILFLTGHSDLTKKAVSKMDFMIQQCDLKKLLRPSVLKPKNNRTGDTSMEKEFRGGNMIAGSITNHNLMRQNDVKKSIADDLDAGEMEKGETGNTVDLIKGRTKAFENQCKRYWVSSPQVKGRSLIEAQFEMSDKRYFNVECPKCSEKIVWRPRIQVDDKNVAGLYWKLDPIGRVDPSSVGYICQCCGNFFDDRDKDEILNTGIWMPTVEPKERNHQGYSITGLYAPHGMTSWFMLAQNHVLCYPEGQPRDEGKYKTYINIDIGEPYEEPSRSVESRTLERNVREYQINTVPNRQSVADGNGQIVMLTWAGDLGGRYIGDQNKSDYDDARLDWEIVAHSENGSTYSVSHGSIGTFTNAFMGNKDPNREIWSYDSGKSNNVWKIVDEILGATYITDEGKQMKILISGIDTGFAEEHVWNYIERCNFIVVGLKGDKEDKFVPLHVEQPVFKLSVSRNNLFLIRVNQLKDKLMARVRFKWNRDESKSQPPGYLNFPQPSGGKYAYENYFSHYESEQRTEDSKGNFIWQKKSARSQNHHFDVNIYNTAVRDIAVYRLFKELKLDTKLYGWTNYANLILTGKI